jgi:hypothetical protein
MFINRNIHTFAAELSAVAPKDKIDRAFALYLTWRQESSACGSAYRRWVSDAHSTAGPLAFAAYTAALDREEQAAAQFEAAVSGGGL